jgi:tetratricopeptide (TPR) repeat protein
MTGMCLAMFKDRKSFALAIVFIIYAATLVIFFSHTRINMPLIVILIPFAVTGLEKMNSYLKNNELKNKAIYAGTLALFFVIEFLPVRDTKDITAYLNTHAIILNSRGKTREAVKFWEKSSGLEKHYSDFASLSLGGFYSSRGDKDTAFSYLDRITDKSYAAAYKYELIGDIMAKDSQYDKAVTAYEKSLGINSGVRATRQKLIKVLLKIDKQKAQEQYEKLIYINSFYTLYGKQKKAGGQ